MPCCLHTDANTEYVYVIGGDQTDAVFWGGCPRDVWRTADGSTFERISINQIPATGLHFGCSLGGSLYHFGGQTDIYEAATVSNQVWRSSDGGRTFERLSDAPWSARGSAGCTVWNNRIWIIGGAVNVVDPTLRTYYNDVWSFDGSSWTQVLANGHSQFSKRMYHSVFVVNGYLCVANGYGGSGNPTNLQSFHYTPNGTEWISRTPNWPASHADAMCVSGSTLVYASGNHNETNTYKLEAFSR